MRFGGPPLRRYSSSHRGRTIACGAKLAIARRSSCSGICGTAPVAAVRERPVERDDEPLRTGAPGTVHDRRHALARAQPVHLEERLRVGLDDLLDRLAPERAETHGGPRRRRRAGDGDLAARADRLDAGGRDDHRHRDLLAQHGGRLVALGRQAGGDARHEAELAERRRCCRRASRRAPPRRQSAS